MAKQLITIGTPGAGGGDPAHAAFKKINDNASELYDAAIPDTEAKKVQARANLGLGAAATRNVGTAAGNVMEVGAFGLGLEVAYNTPVDLNTSNLSTGLYSGSNWDNAPFSKSPDTWGYLIQQNLASAGAGFYELQILGGIAGDLWVRAKIGTNPGAWERIWTTGQTTVDSNGFIKAASPIVKLFADKIELNDEAQLQEITFEKLGAGNYLIKNTLGFAKSGWYVEQPKDANGNVFHAVIYATLENGDISIKTYERKLEGVNIVADLTKPVDIKESRFISIRLHEEVDTTSHEINPAIVDNEGNPAPTRYHVLESGVWVVSDEDAAKLEQERLAAMKPLKRRQFRLTLAMNGYDLKEVEILIDQIEDPMQRTIAQIEWQDAGDFERTNPTLLMMAGLLGLDTDAVDQLWEYGLML